MNNSNTVTLGGETGGYISTQQNNGTKGSVMNDTKVIQNKGSNIDAGILYDYNTRINQQGNWDVTVFTIATDENGFRDQYDFTFSYVPTPEEIVDAILITEANPEYVKEVLFEEEEFDDLGF